MNKPNNCPNCGSENVIAYSTKLSTGWVNEVYCTHCMYAVDSPKLETAIRKWNNQDGKMREVGE